MLFSNRLKALRNSKGMSQKEFAVFLEINPVTLSHYENEKREPDLNRLVDLCSKLNVTADYLLGLSDSPQPTSTNPAQMPISVQTEEIFRSPFDDLLGSYRDQAISFLNYLRQQQEAEMKASNKEA